MKANKIIATGLVGLSLLAGSLYAEDAKVVATVNGTNIDKATLDSVKEMVRRSTQGDQVDSKGILDDLIITELARQEANKSGLAEREDVKNKVKDFTDKLVLNAWTQEKAASFKPSDDELKKLYEERTSTDKQEYKARHILMKTKEEAQGIIKDLENKVDFADLAKKSSDGPSAAMGGDLGWFKLSTMVKPFGDAVAKMEPGTITKEPVQTEFGWHVIKLEERRDVKPPEFDALKPQLEREYQQKKMLAYMEELRSKADVKVMLPEEKPEEKKAEEPKADTKPAEAKPEEKK
ncbi:MAG TPA: peptidylprolyl isomerase [Candidatus Thiothrix moscowensis]|uniref:peptidylprolyl isomerase n=1 Tax=unclassified Thiothrix TaxID=2636184 RepID=UPI0025D23FEB|nr:MULTISPECIES: peptidylprolyl isomerase [unclassified Thiothrix]HRJ52196.1 peptidylprolyl isomerase [Candidatus Thiothrix moscowensis]HRJ92293.1 peptidylprolyl isomerase [Candidatus Thiothrix moscowensis]